MSLELSIGAIIVWLVGAIFGAGVSYAGLKQNKRDINAIGGKLRRFEKNLVLVTMVNEDSREARMFLAQFLKDP